METNRTQQQSPEFDLETRGIHYSEAHEYMPWVRTEEIGRMLLCVGRTGLLRGKTVLDFACGSGAITVPLSAAVGPDGEIFAADDSETNFQRLKNKSGPDLPIKTVLLQPDEKIHLENSSVDMVVSLAGMHHVPDSLRQDVFVEFFRVLKPEGHLVIGDVLDQRPVQSYFQHAVDKICSTGHLHRFLDHAWIQELCERSGLVLQQWNETFVPWIFNSEEEAGIFLRTIHDAKEQFSSQYCLAEAKKYLGWSNDGGLFKLNW